ncbi:MAG TPA: hypothetical protein VMT33_01705 [Candidatus Bathyarchaeia archaeon]|jgi:hypothetical protein|nr:hypothetical protein [Candidatus Bathyarchaeia archaeon]
MNARALRFLPLLFVVATAARAESFPVRHLDPNDAMMALGVRVPELSQDCHLNFRRSTDPRSVGIKGVLDITCGTESTYTKIGAALEAIDTPAATYRFHVVILQASRKEGPEPELPASELKALADFRKVMTYRSFQVEAETVVRSDAEAQGQLGSNYSLRLSLDRNNVGGDAVKVGLFRLYATTPQVHPGTNQPYVPIYIDTSFSIKSGETVVLGASTTDQQARVVLVTALP